MHKPKSARASGFTMLEVMVTIAIIGILTAIAVPNFNAMARRHRMRGAVYDSQSLMRSAQSMSIRLNVTTMLVVNTGTTTTSDDDVMATFRATAGGDETFDFTTVTTAQLMGTAAAPTGWVRINGIHFAKTGGGYPGVGMQPGSSGLITIPAPYNGIPQTAGCTFCNGSGKGAIFFKPTGTALFRGPTTIPTNGSLTFSPMSQWPSPTAAWVTTVSIMGTTGATRVWRK